MKYIIVLQPLTENELPVVFLEDFVHSMMVPKWPVREDLPNGKHRTVLKPMEVVSAGFCEMSDAEVKCWGESDSLGISSEGREDVDAFRIHCHFVLGLTTSTQMLPMTLQFEMVEDAMSHSLSRDKEQKSSPSSSEQLSLPDTTTTTDEHGPDA